MSKSMDVVELTQQLVRIDSINPPGDEERCARFLEATLLEHGFSVSLLPFGARRFNLIAELKGVGEGPVLAFSGHMDTVPLGNAAWSVPPLDGLVQDGNLYGRGSTDMKSGIAAFLVACFESVDLIKQTSGVRLLLTGGEETGCDGARALVSSNPEYLDNVGAVIVGEPTRNYPHIGHKGALWLRGEATGITAHGAMPEEGDNAIYKVVDAISELKELKIPHVHPLMGSPTLNVGNIAGGTNVNSVPDRAVFEVDFRTLPSMSHEALQADISELLGDAIKLTPFVDVPPLASSAKDPWIAKVNKICAQYSRSAAAGIQSKVVPYFTDGSTLVPATSQVPVIILGPGEPQMMHKTDEYCRVDMLHEGVQVYSKIIEDWAFSQAANVDTEQKRAVIS